MNTSEGVLHFLYNITAPKGKSLQTSPQDKVYHLHVGDKPILSAVCPVPGKALQCLIVAPRLLQSIARDPTSVPSEPLKMNTSLQVWSVNRNLVYIGQFQGLDATQVSRHLGSWTAWAFCLAVERGGQL